MLHRDESGYMFHNLKNGAITHVRGAVSDAVLNASKFHVNRFEFLGRFYCCYFNLSTASQLCGLQMH